MYLNLSTGETFSSQAMEDDDMVPKIGCQQFVLSTRQSK